MTVYISFVYHRQHLCTYLLWLPGLQEQCNAYAYRCSCLIIQKCHKSVFLLCSGRHFSLISRLKAFFFRFFFRHWMRQGGLICEQDIVVNGVRKNQELPNAENDRQSDFARLSSMIASEINQIKNSNEHILLLLLFACLNEKFSKSTLGFWLYLFCWFCYFTFYNF